MGLFLCIHPPETRIAILGQILDRVADFPGVTAAGTIQFLPLSWYDVRDRLLDRGRRPRGRTRRERCRPSAGSSAVATSLRWAFR